MIEKSFKLKVESKNLYYAKILSYSYAGIISELTAINEYVYQHIIFKNINTELSNKLLEISITEMKHLSTLGELIKLLGGNPEYNYQNYYSDTMIPWNASYISYINDVNLALKNNIKTENIAILNYKKSIKLIEDENIKKILQDIINDELHHIDIFKSFIK